MPNVDNQRDMALMENLFAEPGAMVTAPGRTMVGASSGMALRPRFRHLTLLAADAVKRMLSHASRTSIRLGSEVFVLRGVSGLSPMPEADVFQLRVGDHSFSLELDRVFQLLEVPADWWENTPGALRADLLADLLRESAFGGDLSVSYLGSNRRAEVSEMSCELGFCLVAENASSAQEHPGRLGFKTSAAAALLVAAWERLPSIGARRLPDFSLPASIEILSARLSVAELKRLRPGALVPVGAPLEGKDVVVSIGWGRRFSAPAVINQKIVTLRGGLKPMEESQAAGAGVALSELSKMENLEVQFTVELATCSLPLSELSRLGAGSTLNLGLPHEPPLVRLCVNGRAVATGELVVLGQSLGVQIVDMASA